MAQQCCLRGDKTSGLTGQGGAGLNPVSPDPAVRGCVLRVSPPRGLSPRGEPPSCLRLVTYPSSPASQEPQWEEDSMPVWSFCRNFSRARQVLRGAGGAGSILQVHLLCLFLLLLGVISVCAIRTVHIVPWRDGATLCFSAFIIKHCS